MRDKHQQGTELVAGKGLARRYREIAWALVEIDKLNFEVARLRRWKLEAKTE